MEYEFDLVCDIDWSHIMTVSKSRCSAVQDLKVEKPSASFMTPVIDWLQSGSSAPSYIVPVAQVIATPQITLDDLLARYGVEAIMNANSGQIPGSQDELDLIAGILAVQS
jgi:hypothetical protein